MTPPQRPLIPAVFCVLALLAAGTAGAQLDMDMGAMQGGPAPPDARDPHAYSDGVDFTQGNARPALADHERFGVLMFDNLELIRADGNTLAPYDIEGWFGNTFERMVLEAEGEIESGDITKARTELLWGHAIAAFWDSRLGIRHDSGEGPDRTWLAAGIAGLAPYRFEIDVTAYLADSSRTALRVDASYDMLLSQRLILQPRLELNLYGEDDPARGLGSGLANAAVALRLRYEYRRELAPYVGLEWVGHYGETRDILRAGGRDTRDTRLMLGLRFWF